MPKDVSTLRTKVAMTVYVSPWIKRGIKTAATLADKTASDVVSDLCIDYLSEHPEIGALVMREG